MSVEEIIATTLATFRIRDSLRSGHLEEVDLTRFMSSASMNGAC
jgi:hypothetical protein